MISLAPPLHAPSGVQPGALGALVRAYKAFVTRLVNGLHRTTGVPVWQRGYHDRIIRNDRELDAIRAYIIDNPRRWAEDRENPSFPYRTG